MYGNYICQFGFQKSYTSPYLFLWSSKMKNSTKFVKDKFPGDTKFIVIQNSMSHTLTPFNTSEGIVMTDKSKIYNPNLVKVLPSDLKKDPS